MAFRIGFLVFPNITQLDMTGPHEVFARLPGSEIHLVVEVAGADRRAGRPAPRAHDHAGRVSRSWISFACRAGPA